MKTTNGKAPAATEAIHDKTLLLKGITFPKPGPYFEPLAPLIPQTPRLAIDWRLPRRQVA